MSPVMQPHALFLRPRTRRATKLRYSPKNDTAMAPRSGNAESGGTRGCLYAPLYMAARRTQVYLTSEQRARLDDLMRRERISLARIVRAAVDAYLGTRRPDPATALRATFRVLPDLEVPAREEWGRHHA